MADNLPKIQIKGMAADVAKFRTDFQNMRQTMSDLSQARGGLAQDIQDATEQFTQMRQDLRFEMEQLGNGGGNSSPPSSTTTTDPAPLTAGSTAPNEPGN